jgi:serine-type D-Ala-D-Ala carboxypeptidase (penicillin-binding protein 5/6)
VSISPLIPPGGGRHERRRGARLGAAAAGLLALAVALAALLGVFSGASARSRSARAAARTAPAAKPAARPQPVPRSPAGLALGTPPLALSDVGAPQRDPLQVRFHKPPGAGLLFDLDSGRVLWQRNARRHVRIASLDKMMTALLVARDEPPQAHVLVTKQAAEAQGSKVGVLPVGRRVRVETMLYGLLLPSGNDAAVALAQRVAGSVPAFVARMNEEAARLGMGCTRYSSPSGYYDEGNFSCAADLAVLAHVDLEQPRLARIVRTLSAVLPFPIKGGKLYLYNNNPLLIYGYPGLTGLKTGYTLAAGRCLVATAQRHGVRLGVVLLDSPAPASQAGRLLDMGFERVYGQAPVARPPIPPEA